MQIKLQNKDIIELSDNGDTVVVAFPDAKITDTQTSIFGPHVADNVIRRPGEYEFAQAGLVALETKELHNGTSELYDVEFRGINCLFVMDGFGSLSKDDWDQLDEVDVILVSLKHKPQGLDKLINRLIPYVVIAIDAESESEAEKLLGLKPLSTSDKFKFTEKDFEAEDPATVLHLLK